jgi:hypothetical protein
MSISKDRIYSCRHCGAEYIAYPPDDVHSESDVNQVPDSIAIVQNVLRKINYIGPGQ